MGNLRESDMVIGERGITRSVAICNVVLASRRGPDEGEEEGEASS